VSLKHFLVTALLCTSGFAAVGAQEGASAGAAPQVPGYKIDSVSYDIVGRTKWWALDDVLDVDKGRVFADRQALDAYVADRTQILVNQRVLDSGTIEVEELPAVSGVPEPVKLVVHTKDTYSIIAMPKPQYDSNDGLLLSVRARDYNFLGTMQPLKLDLNYTVDTSGVQDWGMELKFDMPFRMGDYEYEWDLDQILSYSADNIFTCESVTGVDMVLPIGPGKLKFGPEQGYYLNPDNDDDSVFHGWFFKSTASGAYTLPVAYLGYLGKLDAEVSAGISKYWNPEGLDLLPERDGPTLDFYQKLSFSRVDWLGNFRRGLAASAKIDETYNLEDLGWDRKIDVDVEGYTRLTSWLGLSGRLEAIRYLDKIEDNIGDPLRGILDSRIDTDAALFANVDLPLSVFHFMPHEWFGKSWMRVFAFEQQWSPFLDAGLTHDEKTGRWFDVRDGWYSGGLEVVTYPVAFRSIFVRISAGWDLSALLKAYKEDGISMDTIKCRSTRDGKKGYELFIGLGSQY